MVMPRHNSSTGSVDCCCLSQSPSCSWVPSSAVWSLTPVATSTRQLSCALGVNVQAWHRLVMVQLVQVLQYCTAELVTWPMPSCRAKVSAGSTVSVNVKQAHTLSPVFCAGQAADYAKHTLEVKQQTRRRLAPDTAQTTVSWTPMYTPALPKSG